MKKLRPEYEALVPRIASGELNRQQAAAISAEKTGLGTGSFLVWLHSEGYTEQLKHTRKTLGAENRNSHANPKNEDYDPVKAQAYEDALALAATGKVSIRAAATRFKVSYPYLLKRARKEGLTTAKVDPIKAKNEQEIAQILQMLTDPVKVLALAKALQDLTSKEKIHQNAPPPE